MRLPTIRSISSSIWNATCSAKRRIARIFAKGWWLSRKNARQNLPAAEERLSGEGRGTYADDDVHARGDHAGRKRGQSGNADIRSIDLAQFARIDVIHMVMRRAVPIVENLVLIDTHF